MAEQEPSVTFTDVPDREQAGQEHEISASGNTGIEDSTEDLDVYVEFEIYAGRDRILRETIDGLQQDEAVNVSTTHEFSAGQYDLRVVFVADYYGEFGYSKFSDEKTVEYTRSITITEELFIAGDSEETISLESETTNTLSTSYQDSLAFEISDITKSETGPVPEGQEITFEYENPSISIDTGGNFVTHDIIGGATVRQRIGDKPLEIEISGVCKEDTAGEIELLRNAEKVTLISERFSESSVRCHVASLSTSPLEDGGAAAITDGEFLYTFDLSCVEILDTGDVDAT